MAERSHLSIGEVLSLLREEFPDITISKIRFLESQGLLDPERTPSGYRKFYDDDVEQLRWILRQQREHFLPLKVIKGRLANRDAKGSDNGHEAELPAQEVLAGLDPAGAGIGEAPPAISARAGRRASTTVAEEAEDRPEVETSGDRGPDAVDEQPAAVANAAAGVDRPVVTARPVVPPGDFRRVPAPSGEPEPSAPEPAEPGTDHDRGVTTVGGPALAEDGEGAAESSAEPFEARVPLLPAAAEAAVPGGPEGPGTAGKRGPVEGSEPPAEVGADTGAGREPARVGAGKPVDGTTEMAAGAGGEGLPGTAADTAAGEGSDETVEDGGGATDVAAPAGRSAGGARAARSKGAARPQVPPAAEEASAPAWRDDLTLSELAATAGLSLEATTDLQRFGLLVPRVVGGTAYYDSDALAITNAAAAFAQHGVEARHLRSFKTAADREAGLLEQIVMPLIKQRNPKARQQAVDTIAELSTLGGELRTVLLRQALGDVM